MRDFTGRKHFLNSSKMSTDGKSSHIGVIQQYSSKLEAALNLILHTEYYVYNPTLRKSVDRWQSGLLTPEVCHADRTTCWPSMQATKRHFASSIFCRLLGRRPANVLPLVPTNTQCELGLQLVIGIEDCIVAAPGFLEWQSEPHSPQPSTPRKATTFFVDVSHP